MAAHENALGAGITEGAGNVSRSGSADDAQHSAPDLALQRQAEALHQRGPRPLGELLAEILDGLDADEAEHLRQRISAYNALSPDIYRAMGADRFPPTPIHSADGGVSR